LHFLIVDGILYLNLVVFSITATSSLNQMDGAFSSKYSLFVYFFTG